MPTRIGSKPRSNALYKYLAPTALPQCPVCPKRRFNDGCPWSGLSPEPSTCVSPRLRRRVSQRAKSQTQLFLYFSKFFNCEDQVLLTMPCGNLSADPCFTLRHNRVGEPSHVNSLGEHRIGNLSGKGSLAEHDGHDRVRARQNIKTESRHTLSEEFGIGLESIPQFGRTREQF